MFYAEVFGTMSHFAFESSLSDVIRMDAPVEAGPMLRWQRKALETGIKSMSLDGEYCILTMYIILHVHSR